MSYSSDSISKLHYEKTREFDKWWNENGEEIVRNNLHSFSGLVRNNMEKDYYYDRDFYRCLWVKNHPRIKSTLTEKIHKEWLELFKKDPVMVIDLNTLKLRPPKYK